MESYLFTDTKKFTPENALVYAVCKHVNDFFQASMCRMKHCYHKTSIISHTKSQSLNVSCILLQLPSLNPLKPGVKLRMKK